MATSLKDQYTLSTDSTFQNRVQASLLAACVAIANEGWTVVFHRERATFASQILSIPMQQTNYVTLFANAVATDSSCINDATQNGTVALTAANVAAQAALVTDTHINNAISAMFNSFIRVPSN